MHFAGHKGFTLSLFVQMLGSAFTMAGIAGSHEEDGSGTFVLAIDPDLLSGSDEYMARVTALINYVRSARPLTGQQVVLLGENGDVVTHKAEASGEIEIADAVWNELNAFLSSK